MPTKQVIVKYINSGVGKTGKPYHNIKTPDDEIFWARDEIKGVAQGALVEVDYIVGKGGGNNIVSLRPITSGAGNKSQYRAETPAAEAERIWVNSLLKEFVRAGHVSLDAAVIRGATSVIRTAYHQSWDAPQTVSVKDSRPPVEEDLDDEIPY